MDIAPATASALKDILLVEREAFQGKDEVPELVEHLLRDPSAHPQLSLLAREQERPIGHILFTPAHLETIFQPVRSTLLAPLAVVPDCQGQGIGARLIEHGLQQLAASGVQLVFVFGSPAYYGRHGFVPAFDHGLFSPFPVDMQEAWMVCPLASNLLGSVRGTVRCADALSSPEYWQE